MSKKLAALVIAAVLPLGAQAATETWDLTGHLAYGQGTQTLNINGTPNLTVTGWADDSQVASGDSGNYDAVTQGTIYEYGGGIGVVNSWDGSGSPDHSIDNIGYPDTDMVLLSFDDAVSVEGVHIGWSNGGTADVTIVGYKGADDFNIIEGVDTWGSIAGTGLWTTVAQHMNVSSGYHAVDAVNQFSSRFWLVGACNKFFNSALFDDCDNCTTGGFKLAAVKGSISNGGGEVPIPASILLLLAGLIAMQRSKKTKQPALAA